MVNLLIAIGIAILVFILIGSLSLIDWEKYDA